MHPQQDQLGRSAARLTLVLQRYIANFLFKTWRVDLETLEPGRGSRHGATLLEGPHTTTGGLTIDAGRHMENAPMRRCRQPSQHNNMLLRLEATHIHEYIRFSVCLCLRHSISLSRCLSVSVPLPNAEGVGRLACIGAH